MPDVKIQEVPAVNQTSTGDSLLGVRDGGNGQYIDIRVPVGTLGPEVGPARIAYAFRVGTPDPDYIAGYDEAVTVNLPAQDYPNGVSFDYLLAHFFELTGEENATFTNTDFWVNAIPYKRKTAAEYANQFSNTYIFADVYGASATGGGDTGAIIPFDPLTGTTWDWGSAPESRATLELTANTSISIPATQNGQAGFIYVTGNSHQLTIAGTTYDTDNAQQLLGIVNVGGTLRLSPPATWTVGIPVPVLMSAAFPVGFTGSPGNWNPNGPEAVRDYTNTDGDILLGKNVAFGRVKVADPTTMQKLWVRYWDPTDPNHLLGTVTKSSDFTIGDNDVLDGAGFFVPPNAKVSVGRISALSNAMLVLPTTGGTAARSVAGYSGVGPSGPQPNGFDWSATNSLSFHVPVETYGI